MEHQEDNNLLFFHLPLELVANYLSLGDVLSARASCKTFAAGIDELSPIKCARLLLDNMAERNIYFVTSWQAEARMDTETIVSLLTGNKLTDDCRGDVVPSVVTDRRPSAFSQMLRCFRICSYLPAELVVGFSGKFGRHCLPLRKNRNDIENSPFQLYSSCTRGKAMCRGCRSRIPLSDEAAHHGNHDDDYNNVYDELEIVGTRGKIDLTRFYNRCVPNLAVDIYCPACLNTQERTLVLSEVSYRSATYTYNPSRVMLTYTPHVENRGGPVRDEEGPPRLDFPPLYQDAAYQGHRMFTKCDEKHAIAIHCSACRKFGIISPAAPCDCFERQWYSSARDLPHVMKDTILGNTFVRKRCEAGGCCEPVKCSKCAPHVLVQHNKKHRGDDILFTYRGEGGYCNLCKRRFCWVCSRRHSCDSSTEQHRKRPSL